MVCRNPNRVALKTRLLAFCFSFLFSSPSFCICFYNAYFFFSYLLHFCLLLTSPNFFFNPLFASLCYSILCFQSLSLGITFLTFFECINLPLSSVPSTALQDLLGASLSIRAESTLEAKRCWGSFTQFQKDASDAPFNLLLCWFIALTWHRIEFSKVLKSSEESEDMSTWETRVNWAHFLKGSEAIWPSSKTQ